MAIESRSDWQRRERGYLSQAAKNWDSNPDFGENPFRQQMKRTYVTADNKVVNIPSEQAPAGSRLVPQWGVGLGAPEETTQAPPAAAPAPAPTPTPAPAPALAPVAPATPAPVETAEQRQKQEADNKRRAERQQELTGLFNTAKSGYDWLFANQANFGYKNQGVLNQAKNQYRLSTEALNSLLNSGYLKEEGFSYDIAPAQQLQQQLAAYDSMLSSLTSQRSNELNAILRLAGLQTTAASAADETDEAGFKQALQRIGEYQTRANEFSGDDVQAILDQLTGNKSTVGARLQNVYNQRGAIEDRAQAMINAGKNMEFRRMNELQNPYAQAQVVDADIKRWNATQASDEHKVIADFLNAHRDRIQKDMDTVAAEQKQQADAYRQLLAGLASQQQERELAKRNLAASVETAQGGIRPQAIEPVANFDASAILQALGLV